MNRLRQKFIYDIKGFLTFEYSAFSLLVTLPFLYLTNIFDPIIEKVIRTHSKKKKTLEVAIHLLFIMTLLNSAGFHDTP